MNKAFIAISQVALLFLFIAQCGAVEPIKILDLDPQSGVMKDVGERYQMAVKFWEEEVNAAGGINGRPVKVYYDDHQTKPDIATRKAIKYITEENVQYITTGVGTHIVSALEQVADKYKVILFSLSPAGDSLTGKEFTPYYFRSNLQNTQTAGGLAAYFAKSKYKKYYILCQDYAFGHDVAAAFKAGMKRHNADWELVGEDYHPIGTKDLGPYITKVISSGAEVLITGNFGPDLINLLQQSRTLGLKAKYGTYYMEDVYILKEVKNAAVGAITAEDYALTVDTPMNKDFVERWHKRMMDQNIPYPDSYIGKGYQGIKFLGEAIKKAKSANPDDVITAWEGLSMQNLTGTWTMRPCDHQLIAPVVISEVMGGPNPYYDFPYVGVPTLIPAEEAAMPQSEVDNPRCK